MSEKEVLLTRQGFENIEAELEELKAVKRLEVAGRIKEALAFGDISENSEYDEAKNEQAQLEEKIAKLEATLRKAKIVDETAIPKDVVGVGVTVLIKDLEFDEDVEYTIVGAAEADPMELKISNESPVGKALLGKREGEKVEVQVPDGVVEYQILEIRR